jgi:hypothetical protein
MCWSHRQRLESHRQWEARDNGVSKISIFIRQSRHPSAKTTFHGSVTSKISTHCIPHPCYLKVALEQRAEGHDVRVLQFIGEQPRE